MGTDLDRVFSALADPTRRRILLMLVERDMTVTEIAASFEITFAGVSKHLRTLGKAGLISRRREGRQSWCRIELETFAPAFAWMREFGFIESTLLGALEELIDCRPDFSGEGGLRKLTENPADWS